MRCFGILLCALAACRGSTHDSDEARVRALLAIPADAKLVSLQASPDANGWQREGLRIVAVFHVATTPASFSSPPWASLPMPPGVATFRRPPVELPSPVAGSYRCEVGVYTTGSSHAMKPCASAPAQFDMYQAATFDPATHDISAVVTYYY